MANNTLKARLVLSAKTATDWASDTKVILAGELAVELDTRKIKVGNGVDTYKNLAYINMTPEEVNSLIAATGHSHSNKDILDATSASFTTALLTKLNGITDGANKIVIDSAMSTTSANPVQNKVVQSALDGKVTTSRTINGKALTSNISLTSSDVGALASTLKGAASGVAELDSSGKVPASQLPSFVDDVVEGYFYNSKFYKDSAHGSEITGENSKIYIDLSTEKTYRWSGSIYVVISETLVLGETSSTAYRGDRGKVAYDHSQSAHAPSNAERNIITGIQKNGTDISVDGSTRKVNISVPTKVSELTNDSAYLTSSGTISNANTLTNSRTIDGVSFNGSANITHFSTCSTAASTAAKVVSLTGFALATGAKIAIKFTVTNTASSPTLNVNSTGAKSIMYRGSAISAGYLASNRVYEFIYDGTDYELIGDLDTNTTYTAGAGLTLTSGQFKHSNLVTAGTASGSSGAIGFGGTVNIPSITYDAQGHVTSKTTTSITLPATPTTITGNAGTATKLQNSRNFSITGGATAATVSFDGSANVALSVTNLDAAKLSIATTDTLILDGNW